MLSRPLTMIGTVILLDRVAIGTEVSEENFSRTIFLFSFFSFAPVIYAIHADLVIILPIKAVVTCLEKNFYLLKKSFAQCPQILIK